MSAIFIGENIRQITSKSRQNFAGNFSLICHETNTLKTLIFADVNLVIFRMDLFSWIGKF